MIYKIFTAIILKREKSPFLLNEENAQDNNDSTKKELYMSVYLCLSFIIFIIYRELSKYVFVNGFFGRFAKEFYLCFII